MAKRPKFGVITKPKRDKPRKRPGRHKKRRNKHEKRMGKYRGKGRKGGWQLSYKILYYPCSLNYPIMELFELHFAKNK